MRTLGGSPRHWLAIRVSPGSSYAGSPDSPYYALAQKYLRGQACSLLTFGVHGGAEAGARFYDALQLGEAAGQSGRREIRRLPPGVDDASPDDAEQQRKAGITPETIRLSVGIEHIDDILADIDQALAAAAQAPARAAAG